MRNPRCVSPRRSRAVEVVVAQSPTSLDRTVHKATEARHRVSERLGFYRYGEGYGGQKTSRSRSTLSPDSRSRVSSFTRSARTSSMVVSAADDPTSPSDLLKLVSSPSSRSASCRFPLFTSSAPQCVCPPSASSSCSGGGARSANRTAASASTISRTRTFADASDDDDDDDDSACGPSGWVRVLALE